MSAANTLKEGLQEIFEHFEAISCSKAPSSVASRASSNHGKWDSQLNLMVHVPSVAQNYAKRVGLSPERQVPGWLRCAICRASMASSRSA